MTFRLSRFPSDVPLIDVKTGRALPILQRWMQRFAEGIEAELGALEAAQTAAAAATTATAAATTAAAAAATAQTAADTAQAAVDAIVVPPTGSQTITANYASTADDYTLLVDASAGAVTITLHTAASALNNLEVQKIDASANAVSVVPQGGNTLNGGAGSVSTTTQYAWMSFASDTTSAWFGG